MFRTFAAAAAALTIGAAAASAESVGIDANGDGFVTANEYTRASQERDHAAAFDADGDGTITRDEFNTGMWKMYDRDDDGQWNSDEAAAFEDDYIRAGKWKR